MREKKLASMLLMAGCILFCLTLPWSLPLNNVAISLIIIGWLMEGNFREKVERIRKSRTLVWPIGFYLLHVIGLAYTTGFQEAGGQLETKASVLLLPCCLGTTSLLNRDAVKTILRSFVLSNLVVGIYCIITAYFLYTESGSKDHFYYHRLTETIDLHAIYFALYLSLSIVIILYFETLKEPLFNRKVDVMIVMAFFIIITLLAALTIMFILPLLVLYLLSKNLISQWQTSVRIAMLVSSLIGFFLLTYFLPYTRTKLEKLQNLEYSMGFEDYQWTSLTIRLAKWKCASDVIRQHWIFGVGTGDAQAALMDSYWKNGFSEGLRNNYNTHNQYLETWIMLGLPGLAMLFLMLWPEFKDSLWICFLALIGFSFLTENMLNAQKGVVFFSFFYSLLFILLSSSANPSTAQWAKPID